MEHPEPSPESEGGGADQQHPGDDGDELLSFNIFEVLFPGDEVDAWEEEEEEEEGVEAGPRPKGRGGSLAAPGDAAKEPLDSDDWDLAMACYMLDWEAGAVAVKEAWEEAKEGRTSAIAAAAVTSAAVLAVRRNEAELQLLFPGAGDTKGRLDALVALSSRDRALLAQIEDNLRQLGEVFDGKEFKTSREGAFGPRFDENFRPLEAEHLQMAASRLQLYDISTLYNIYLLGGDGDKGPTGLDRLSDVEGCFVPLLREFFRTRQPSPELVFACQCWLSSALAMQGGSMVSRTAAKVKMEAKRLLDQYGARPTDSGPDAWIFRQRPRSPMEDTRTRMYVAALVYGSDDLIRRNPWMAGRLHLVLNAHHLQDGVCILWADMHLKAAAHVYSMLRSRGALPEPLPLLDRVIAGLGESAIFIGGRAEPGALIRSFMMSGNMSAEACALLAR